MDPNLDPSMIRIRVQEEIDAIKAYLAQAGESAAVASMAMQTFTESSGDRPIAKHKVIAAKRRKQKRKNGGPR